jgi:hypothetical protein
VGAALAAASGNSERRTLGSVVVIVAAGDAGDAGAGAGAGVVPVLGSTRGVARMVGTGDAAGVTGALGTLGAIVAAGTGDGAPEPIAAGISPAATKKKNPAIERRTPMP